MWEASISAFPGDRTKLLGINWLARLGAGLEFDVSQTGIPVVKKGRLSARYVFGDDYQGVSIGIGTGLDGWANPPRGSVCDPLPFEIRRD